MGIKEIADKKLNIAKGKVKNFLIKKVIIPVIAVLLFIILVAGAFIVVIEGIKEAAEKVVDTAGSVFSSLFDNKSDAPMVKIDDGLIDTIKKEMEGNAIDLKATYLTDELLKKSLKAYYATQYPYIEGVDYTDEDVVKGCIYLKRADSNGYMSYINYKSFKEKLGDNKTANNVENAKKYFSVDDDDNLVVATWSKSSESVENVENNYQQEGSLIGGYSITEYKIDHKTITSQYAMSYKLPILLANLYSNEGFGKAVADLGINSKIELTILDSTVETTTITKEYLKMNYKASGTYSWRHFESDPLTTESFQDITWVKDYTTEQNVYEIRTQVTEENTITVKPTLLDTWVLKGEITDINKETNETNSSNTTTLENNPKDYTVDPNTTITEEQKKAIIQKVLESRSDIIENSIESVNATVYKKMTDHSMTTIINTKEVTYTSSDMELVDNTDKFLALIRANLNGEFDKKGELVKYIKKEKDNSLNPDSDDYYEGDDSEADIESEFLSSIDMLIEILEDDKDISDYANIMKYIYYKYTDDEAYKTELDFSAYNTNDFNEVGSSAASGSGFEQFKKWLHGWEGGSVTKDGKYYIVESDGSATGSAVGHGVDIKTHGAKLRAAGYDTSIGSKIPVDIVDAIEEKEINGKIADVKSKTKGLNLTDYQIYALVSRAYNCGTTGAFSTRNGLNFKTAYNQYWKQDRDDKYGKKDKVDYSHNLYSKYMYLPNTSQGRFLQGLENRRKSEWLLFQTGWFDDRGNVKEYCSTNSGGDFLEVAKQCWVRVCTSGKYTTYGGTSIPAKGPSIDCSSYASWVLYEYGYKDFKGLQHTAQSFYKTNWKKKYGWKEIPVGSGQNPKDKLQPGDIFVRYGAGTHHVTIVESIKKGKLYAYDCGNSSNWLVKGGKGNSIDRSYFLTEQGAGKIIRVTPPKTKRK